MYIGSNTSAGHNKGLVGAIKIAEDYKTWINHCMVNQNQCLPKVRESLGDNAF